MSLQDIAQRLKARGNWGHSGRPGKVGGSTPGSGSGGSANPARKVLDASAGMKTIANKLPWVDLDNTKYYPNAKQAVISFTKRPDTLAVEDALVKSAYTKTPRRTAQTQDSIWEAPDKQSYAYFNSTTNTVNLYDADYTDRGGRNPFA